MKKLLVALILSCVVVAEGVLPPLYNSIEEIKTILEDERLADALTSGQAIVSIKRNEAGYEIQTPKYLLEVGVTYLPQAMPGPAKFSLTFQEPTLSK